MSTDLGHGDKSGEGTTPFDLSVGDWTRQPVARWAGVERLQRGDGEAELEVPVAAHHRGGGGTEAVNGAYLAYLADLLSGAAASTAWGTSDIGQVTVTMNVNYLRPLDGARLIGSASAVHCGRRICFVQGTISDEAGSPGISINAVFRRVRLEAPDSNREAAVSRLRET